MWKLDEDANMHLLIEAIGWEKGFPIEKIVFYMMYLLHSRAVKRKGYTVTKALVCPPLFDECNRFRILKSGICFIVEVPPQFPNGSANFCSH